ncbi:hypothetical protein TARUN_3483 [Trichoderma arundinaceum]|uniref:Immunoglobulin variable region used by the itc63b heavy chain n=1 Tax=Trichoderma arundinaceum TaxID=490622 RepID=A0A395NSH3_TRIAR|nr:hypothetical protein TARUN_3483 [Trichoderma arundinaceum]
MSSSGSTPLTPITSVGSMSSHIDKVVPTADQSGIVSNFSTVLWQGILKAAKNMSLDRNTVNLTGLTKYGPKLPDDLEGATELLGFAIWHIADEPRPNQHPNLTHGPRTGLRRQWDLMKPRPTVCEISERKDFNFSDSASNGLAFMFLAWSYIISVYLLEEQKTPVIYEEATAPSGDETPTGNQFIVDLGDASDEECRWWSALLSPGQGWKAADSGLPVWAVTYTGNMKFVVMNQPTASGPSEDEPCEEGPTQIRPPTSREAVRFLSRFASMYDLESQAALGLAMALTIPLHDNMSSTIQLPEPHLVRPNEAFHLSMVDKEFRNLSYYMVLSSNPAFFASALWAVFWEPEIDCNLVSSWCDPIIDIVKPLIEAENFELLGHVLALRRPGVGALWYGLAACGATETILAIVPFLQTLHTPVPARLLAEVSIWTDTPQSFMDLSGSGPYLQGNQISRADLWRIRHEYWNAWKDGVHFRHPPTTPFQPFGYIDSDEVESMIRGHVDCPRHHWEYTGFTWSLQNGIELTHEPCVLPTPSFAQFDTEPHLYLPPAGSGEPDHDIDHTASRRAVGDMFRWATTEIEKSGRSIYSHPWVNVKSHFAFVDKEGKRGPRTLMRLSELTMARVREWVANREDDEEVAGAGED